MTKPTSCTGDVLDLNDLPPDHRATSLSRAFRFLSPGEEFIVVGHGDPSRYQRLLDSEFSNSVIWAADVHDDGRWVVTVGKAPV